MERWRHGVWRLGLPGRWRGQRARLVARPESAHPREFSAGIERPRRYPIVPPSRRPGPRSTSAPVRARTWLLLAFAAAPVSAQLQQPELWSLRRPERPPVPAVTAAAWVRNPIDAFVLARLERAGLRPSAEADRPTLLRRLSLDLCGLPPTPDEVAEFVADRRPDAYERQVDRLQSSPHYGERMAQPWLDLAHYTDTNGYDFDTDRDMWAWRDWVVEALNRDLPFDQFTTAQLAGDLLPDATLSQRIATGFLRNHAVANDALGEPGEYRHHYVADRVATTATTWLGFTIGCAECHDHKFDPISQRDYYGFYAFFDHMAERGLRAGNGNAEPRLRLPTAAQGTQLLELQAQLDDLDRRQRQRAAAAVAAQGEWVSALAQAAPPAALDGLLLHVDLDADRPGQAQLVGIGRSAFVPGVRGQALWLDGKDSFVQLDQQASFRADAPFSLSAWVRLDVEALSDTGAVVGKVDEARGYRGYWLEVRRGVPALVLAVDADQEVLLDATARDALAVGEWHHLLATYDGSRLAGGLRLYVDGAPAPLAPVRADAPAPKPLPEDIDNDGRLRIGAIDGMAFAGAIDEVRLFDRALPAAAAAALVAADLQAAAAAPGARELEDLLRQQFLAHVDAEASALAAERATITAQRDQLLAKVPQVSVMSEMAVPRQTHVLLRGDFSRPDEAVEPAVPPALGALPADAPPNRLGLARWLTDRDNPLVGRVAANRLWRQFFGRGLCETVDDFGSRGELPSHPELLDWLAREFVDSGFQQKRFVKLLVTSATYRQQSQVDAALLERDPDNRLLARSTRWRLDAETLRDNALAIAGLLDLRLGGPSIKPWQPEDLWKEPSPPDQRRRRGLYVQVKRHAPFAAFTLFDAPSREVCTPRRDLTSTPLQALVLLNERNHVEAARGLAQLLLGTVGDDRERLARGFQRCTARAPEAQELEVLLQLLHCQREDYRSHADAAAALLAVGDVPVPEALTKPELAAWTAVAAVLLNLDETITRG